MMAHELWHAGRFTWQRREYPPPPETRLGCWKSYLEEGEGGVLNVVDEKTQRFGRWFAGHRIVMRWDQTEDGNQVLLHLRLAGCQDLNKRTTDLRPEAVTLFCSALKDLHPHSWFQHWLWPEGEAHADRSFLGCVGDAIAEGLEDCELFAHFEAPILVELWQSVQKMKVESE